MASPRASSFPSVTGPTPGIARTGNGEMNSISSPGAMIRTPLGFAASEASLARNLLLPTPTDAVNPAVRLVSSARSPATCSSSFARFHLLASRST